MVNDSYRNYFQLLVVSLVMACVSLIMAILNVVGGNEIMSIVCFIYAGCSAVNVCWLIVTKCVKTRHNLLFGVSTTALFIYILLTGGVSSVSAMWLLFLPTSGIALLGRARGSAMCGAMFVVLVLLFWFPFGDKLLLFDYPAAFRIRFPIIYAVFFLIGYWFEDVRSKTQAELVSVKNKMKEISETDALTGLKNRYWFNRKIARKYNGRLTDGDSVMMLWDIDFFKNLNDTYGHAAGDCVLIRHAEEMKNVFPETALYCRWGGVYCFSARLRKGRGARRMRNPADNAFVGAHSGRRRMPDRSDGQRRRDLSAERNGIPFFGAFYGVRPGSLRIEKQRQELRDLPRCGKLGDPRCGRGIERGGINLYKSLNGIFDQTKKATGEKRGGFGALVFPRFFYAVPQKRERARRE